MLTNSTVLSGRDICTSGRLVMVLDIALYLSCIVIFFVPELAQAQETESKPFGGITDFLRSITKLLIMEWGYYIGIITLAIQGYRWKTGRIDLLQLAGWGLGIGLVFFAPSIVADLRSRAGSIS